MSANKKIEEAQEHIRQAEKRLVKIHFSRSLAGIVWMCVWVYVGVCGCVCVLDFSHGF